MRSKFKWIYALLVAITMQFSFAQEKTITGTVSDNLGLLPGVNVSVKGSTRRVSTDFDGKYAIKAKEGEVLVFSFVEMANAEKTVGASSVVNVSMKGATILNEVIVGALGIKRTKDATTTQNQVVTNKIITQAANPSVIQSLTGKVSGLQISTTSSGVNSTTRIVLRGSRSIGGNNEALIVIDGAISSSNVLSQLPPEIVETANVIKGAQGAALYGEQGANGVIIVTTKKGVSKGSKMTVDFNNSIDFETIAYLPQRQAAYGQGWTDPSFDFGGTDPRNGGGRFVPWENGAWGPSFADPKFAGTTVPVGLPQADGKFFTTQWVSKGSDNVKDFFTTGNILQNSVTVNVGGDDGYVLLNIKRENRDFMIEGDKLRRTSFLFKAGKKFGKFSVDGNVNYSSQSTSQSNSPDLAADTNTLFDDLLQAATNIPIGQFANSTTAHHWTVYALNPFELNRNVRSDRQETLFNGVLNLGYQFNKHISVNYTLNSQFRGVLGQDHNDGINVANYNYDFAANGYSYTYAGGNSGTYQDFLGGSAPDPSYFYDTQSQRKKVYSDFLINFDYNLTNDLNFKLNLGNNIQDDTYNVIRQGGFNLDIPKFYNISNVLNRDLPSSNSLRDFNKFERVRRIAGFYNVDLDYKKFLFLNTTGRLENTSTVKNSFFYPSVGIGFVPTKAFESIKDNKYLSYAKISGNYVINGNSSAAPVYETNSLANTGAGFPFGNLAGFQFNRSPTDVNIKPEIVTTRELNVNLGFFKDRLTFDGSVYLATTKDLISRVTASTTSGAATVNGNIGSLENRGFEIDLGITPIKTDNFTWNMKASYSTFKTKITSLAEGNTSVSLQQNNFIGIFAEIGEEFPLLKGTAYQRSPDGYIIVDGTGNPLRTSTFEKLGKTTPDYILNFTNTFNYKGLSLTSVMDFRTGHSFYSAQYSRLATFGYSEESASQDRTVGYVVPNSVVQGTFLPNTTPVNGGGYNGVLNYFSGRYDSTGESQVLDATAFRIREISLSYSLPAKLIKSAGLQSVRFGINARNPFIFFGNPFNKRGNNLGYADPEASNTVGITSNNSSAVNATGLAGAGSYPAAKTYGFSLNVTF